VVQAECKQAGGPSVRVELGEGQGARSWSWMRGIKILALVGTPPQELEWQRLPREALNRAPPGERNDGVIAGRNSAGPRNREAADLQIPPVLLLSSLLATRPTRSVWRDSALTIAHRTTRLGPDCTDDKSRVAAVRVDPWWTPSEYPSSSLGIGVQTALTRNRRAHGRCLRTGT